MVDTQTLGVEAVRSSNIPFTPDLLGHYRANLNVALLGTCQVDNLTSTAASRRHNINHMLMESWQHSLIPSFDCSKMDAAVISLTLRHIFADATGMPLGPADMTLAKLRNAEEVDDLLSRCAHLIDSKLSDIGRALHGLPIFVMSFLEPSFNYQGNLLNPYSGVSPRRVIRKLNSHLAERVCRMSSCYIIDVNDIINFVGRMHLHDDVLSGSLHASFIDEGLTNLDSKRLITPVSNYSLFDVSNHIEFFAETFWRLISDNMEIIRQNQPIKLVIVDLDDTLWRGVAAEDDFEHWRRIEGWPIGFVESLLVYKSRGGLLAVCSKNDQDATLKRLTDIWKGAITEDDFVSIKINWDSKADNVAKIADDTNILTQNMLFIDDNPRELDEVIARFPDIRVMAGRHYDWRRIIMRSPQTQMHVITDESSRRTDLVKARIEREAMRPKLSRSEWLTSLNLHEKISVISAFESPEGARAFELINKTNQFNTTGKRWSAAEFQEFLRNGGVCLTADLNDRNIDNGIVGVTLIRDGEIVQSVLSCRVFGLGAEIAMGRVATAVALRQAEKAIGRIVDSGKNFSCHKFFEEIGFRRNGEYFETTEICEVPSWINLTVSLEVIAG
jgi:FkbH-like protein